MLDALIERLETLRLQRANRPKFGLGQWEAVYEDGKDAARDSEIEFLEELLRPTAKEFRGYE